MRVEQFEREVNLPSVREFVARYPHYVVVDSAERYLFDTIMTAENFIRAAAVTDSLGLPAVSAVADRVKNVCQGRGGLTGFRKQLSGAITCSLMEANHYSKTGLKRAISRSGWSRGEVYESVLA